MLVASIDFRAPLRAKQNGLHRALCRVTGHCPNPSFPILEGYRVYFGKDGDTLVILLAGNEKRPGSRHRNRARTVEGLQEAQVVGDMTMPLTREFKETVQARIRQDRNYRKALLREGVESLLAGDLDTGKAILRDYINGTMGFEELSRVTKRPTKSLMRMFGPAGNPQARNLFEVIGHLQRAEGLQFELALKAAS
jgi:hypothetical protein